MASASNRRPMWVTVIFIVVGLQLLDALCSLVRAHLALIAVIVLVFIAAEGVHLFRARRAQHQEQATSLKRRVERDL